MHPTRPVGSLRQDAALLAVFASLLLAAHLLTGDGYGFHRDELQFLDDARHLQWGFVACPPLTSFCGRLAIALFGISPAALRLPAALANMASLVLTGLIARELGGGRPSQVLALFAALPACLAFSSVLQYNTFDMLSWLILIWSTARVLRTGDARNWIGAGVGVGLGVLSKYSIAFPAASLLLALVALPWGRRQMRGRWFWAGVAVAAGIAAPNLVWLATHGFITLRMERFIHARDVRLGRTDGFFTDQLRFTLFALPLALAGLVALLRTPRLRLLSVFYLGPLVLLALAHGRGYYLLPGYPVLYAAGAVALEQALALRSRALRLTVRAAVLTAMLADAGVVGWIYLPLWQPGSAPWNWQMTHNADMADEIGWPEFVQQVAGVRDQLTPAERGSLAVLANNYGEAGALALYGPGYGLPVPISSTNTFHLRGFGGFEPQTVIVTGGDLEDQLKNFQSCRVAARVTIPHGVLNEESRDHRQILVCHSLRGSWPAVWSRSQEFG